MFAFWYKIMFLDIEYGITDTWFSWHIFYSFNCVLSILVVYDHVDYVARLFCFIFWLKFYAPSDQRHGDLILGLINMSDAPRRISEFLKRTILSEDEHFCLTSFVQAFRGCLKQLFLSPLESLWMSLLNYKSLSPMWTLQFICEHQSIHKTERSKKRGRFDLSSQHSVQLMFLPGWKKI